MAFSHMTLAIKYLFSNVSTSSINSPYYTVDDWINPINLELWKFLLWTPPIFSSFFCLYIYIYIYIYIYWFCCFVVSSIFTALQIYINTDPTLIISIQEKNGVLQLLKHDERKIVLLLYNLLLQMNVSSGFY